MVELIETRVEKGFETSMSEEQMRSSNMEGVSDSGNNYGNVCHYRRELHRCG